jgi:hypothetical protein
VGCGSKRYTMEVCGGRRIVEGQKKMERPSEYPDPKIIGTGQDMYVCIGKLVKIVFL